MQTRVLRQMEMLSLAWQYLPPRSITLHLKHNKQERKDLDKSGDGNVAEEVLMQRRLNVMGDVQDCMITGY